MSHSFLLELGKEKNFLVYNSVIYEMTKDSFCHDFFISIGGVKRFFSRTDSLHVFEKGKYFDFANQKFDDLEQKILENETTLLNELNSLKVEQDNLYMDFIKKFMDYLNNTQIQPNVESYSFDRKNIISKSFVKSFFSKIFDNQNYLFMNGGAFKLEPINKSRNVEQYVQVDGIKYNLNWQNSVDDFALNYETGVNSFLEKIITEQEENVKEHMKYEKEKFIELRKKIPDVEGYGYKKLGDNYYLYRTFNSVSYNSKIDGGTTFLFPSAKIALKLCLENRTVKIDTNGDSGRCRVLEAKQVREGKEVGKFISLKGKNFIHPASTTSTKNPYPYFCFAGEPSNKNMTSNLEEVKKFFNFMAISYKIGYKDRGQGATLYNYLDDMENIKIFFPNRVTNRSESYNR